VNKKEFINEKLNYIHSTAFAMGRERKWVKEYIYDGEIPRQHHHVVKCFIILNPDASSSKFNLLK
jgi:hypothetical protein